MIKEMLKNIIDYDIIFKVSGRSIENIKELEKYI